MSYTNDMTESELLAKFLSGEASPEEAMAADDLISAKKNSEDYQALFNLWKGDYQTPRADEAWFGFQSALEAKNSLHKRTGRRVFLAAASIMLLAGVLTSLYFLTRTNPAAQPKWTQLEANGKSLGSSLPDGSGIVLFKGSSARYAASFNKNSRALELSGRGYFKVIPDKARPFIISVGKLKIKVVGTSFDVAEYEGLVRVQVETGIVEMYTDNSRVRVHRGQSCQYDPVRNSFSVSDSVDTNSFSYATRKFIFNDLPLTEVVKLLQEAFDVNILVEGRGLQNCRLTAAFENKSLEYMVEIISVTVNSSYSIRGNNIKIYGKGCE